MFDVKGFGGEDEDMLGDRNLNLVAVCMLAGSTPYCTMSAREVMRRVRDGYRLERPAHCRAELFRVVQRCWHADPAKRPDFGDLRRALADLLEDAARGGSYVDLEGLATEASKASVGGGGVPGAAAALAVNSRASSAEINV